MKGSSDLSCAQTEPETTKHTSQVDAIARVKPTAIIRTIGSYAVLNDDEGEAVWHSRAACPCQVLHDTRYKPKPTRPHKQLRISYFWKSNKAFASAASLLLKHPTEICVFNVVEFFFFIGIKTGCQWQTCSQVVLPCSNSFILWPEEQISVLTVPQSDLFSFF